MNKNINIRLFFIIIPGLIMMGILSFILLSSENSPVKGKKDTVEFGEVLYNSVLKNDLSGIKKIDLTKGKVDQYKKDFKVRSIKSLKDRANRMNISDVPDRYYNDLFDIFLKGIKKSTFEVTEISNSSEKAVIEYSVNGVDLNPHLKEIRNILKQSYADDNDIGDKALFKQMIDIYERRVNRGAISKTPKTTQIDIIYSDGIWQISNDYQMAELFDIALTF